ncbi:hypothetical protein EJ06DRAFT_553849 [Trichodelitschia bisporula]|uniref:Uncharacterized protein n=1 Tax=Trichodelitschia bisporula TaxID=703511 RepID=A0A6G1I5J4_9PEZI|nr:hypothetical protein EJ06DRAFT_553849 [Trichodelitschia bisporula]
MASTPPIPAYDPAFEDALEELLLSPRPPPPTDENVKVNMNGVVGAHYSGAHTTNSMNANHFNAGSTTPLADVDAAMLPTPTSPRASPPAAPAIIPLTSAARTGPLLHATLPIPLPARGSSIYAPHAPLRGTHDVVPDTASVEDMAAALVAGYGCRSAAALEMEIERMVLELGEKARSVARRRREGRMGNERVAEEVGKLEDERRMERKVELRWRVKGGG